MRSWKRVWVSEWVSEWVRESVCELSEWGREREREREREHVEFLRCNMMGMYCTPYSNIPEGCVLFGPQFARFSTFIYPILTIFALCIWSLTKLLRIRLKSPLAFISCSWFFQQLFRGTPPAPPWPSLPDGHNIFWAPKARRLCSSNKKNECM